MLVNLSKRQIHLLREFIAYNNDIDHELDEIYDKLSGIVAACTCKEQNEDWVCKLTPKAELSDHFW